MRTPRAADAAMLLALAALGSGCRRGAPASNAAGAPPVITTKTGVEMVLVPAGWFLMGSDGGAANEAPAHRVWVDAFLIDRHEVTQDQFRRLQMPDPSHFKGPRRPVEHITLADAIEFCNERSDAEGLRPCYVVDDAAQTWRCDFTADGYRLPTEAEWEYACRAGVAGERHFGSSGQRALRQYAWFADNAGKRTHPVGTRRANPWGLYDMYGNVSEWCNDFYAADYYMSSPDRNPRGPARAKRVVLRGGAWDCKAERCRSAWRAGEDPRFQDICFAKDTIGFRCVRKAPPPAPAPAALALKATAAASGPATRPAARTAVLHDDVYLEHKTTPGHPECPARLKAIVDRLGKAGLLAKATRLSPRDAAVEWITTIHSPQYVRRAKARCRQGAEYVDHDVPASRESYDVAVKAAGGVLVAVDAVVAGKAANAFCAVRPPGHHALRDKGMGFCIFNNVAIAARYVQKKHKLKKVLIVDWDVHHGNGTQAVFYDDPTVMYFSTHQYPFYPGTGSADERGEGKGKGFTLNVPLARGATDADLVKIFRERLAPAALAFKPDFVIISAGFDSHADDPLGGMKLTAAGFAKLTRIVKGIAAKCCKGRLVSVLEGGYNLPALAESVEAHVRVLME